MKTLTKEEHVCNIPEILDQDLYKTWDCECGVVYQLLPCPTVGQDKYWAIVGIDIGEE